MTTKVRWTKEALEKTARLLTTGIVLQDHFIVGLRGITPQENIDVLEARLTLEELKQDAKAAPGLHADPAAKKALTALNGYSFSYTHNFLSRQLAEGKAIDPKQLVVALENGGEDAAERVKIICHALRKIKKEVPNDSAIGQSLAWMMKEPDWQKVILAEGTLVTKEKKTEARVRDDYAELRNELPAFIDRFLETGTIIDAKIGDRIDLIKCAAACRKGTLTYEQVEEKRAEQKQRGVIADVHFVEEYCGKGLVELGTIGRLMQAKDVLLDARALGLKGTDNWFKKIEAVLPSLEKAVDARKDWPEKMAGQSANRMAVRQLARQVAEETGRGDYWERYTAALREQDADKSRTR